MAEQTFLRQMKELVFSYYRDGEIKDRPTGTLGEKIKDSEINEFLRGYVGLLVSTRFLSDEGRIYIMDPYITYRGVTQKLTNTGVKEANSNTVQSKVFWDKNKMLRYFGDSFYKDLVLYGKKDNLPYLNAQLNKALEVYSYGKVLQKGIAVKLPDTDDIQCSPEISDERFDEFIGIILPYTNKQMQAVSSLIDKEVVKYCKDLLGASGELSDKEIERKQLLMDML